jgi:hypothetical protein
MKTIALFIHQPMCSVQCGNGMIKALSPDYRFKIFTKQEVEDTFFDDVDIVAFPGGAGNSDAYDYLLTKNKDAIYKFLAQGGKYLGICMGAYWAGHHYFNILNNIEVVQYIQRPSSGIRRYYDKAIDIQWNYTSMFGDTETQKHRMFFHDGCTFLGNPSTFQTVATYSNGDPMAIIQKNIGIIGCHPESEQSWYHREYMKPHWHQGEQHELLRNFVSRLIDS